MKRMKFFIAGILSLMIFASANVFAQDDIRKKQVKFEKGAAGETIKDQLKGYQIVDYLLGAKAGQSMTVILETDNPSNYFNVTAPGADTSIFIGSTSGNRFKGKLPKSGDYTVRVYLMRNAARRGETANYTINFNIAGDE
jgi:hypothetical protein